MSDLDSIPSTHSTGGPDNEADGASDVLAVMGLREPPFSETSSDTFFFPSQQHIRVGGFIGQLLWSRANLAVVTGLPGAGKSLLIRRLAGDLDDRVLLAHVEAAGADPQEFLREVLKQFGMELKEADRNDRRRLLSRFLTHQFNQNRLCLLAVENVHALKPAVLEELRLIGEMEVEGKRLIKLLLLGGHSLNHVVDSPRMALLATGRAPRMQLESFSEDQVAAYIAHRLRAAGAVDADSLASTALTPQIHRYTGGVPGAINALCERAMMVALRRGEVRLTAEAVTEAAEELAIVPTAAEIETIVDAAPGSTNEEQALLLITSQGLPDGVVPLTATRILIGRSELADVRIDSAFVSRYHSLIVREGGRDLLIDLGSTNGVLVNGKRVIRSLLKHRDLIQVGPARVTYLNPAIAPQAPGDSSETLKFARPGVADASADNALLAFGRFDEAG